MCLAGQNELDTCSAALRHQPCEIAAKNGRISSRHQIINHNHERSVILNPRSSAQLCEHILVGNGSRGKGAETQRNQATQASLVFVVEIWSRDQQARTPVEHTSSPVGYSPRLPCAAHTE